MIKGCCCPAFIAPAWPRLQSQLRASLVKNRNLFGPCSRALPVACSLGSCSGPRCVQCMLLDPRAKFGTYDLEVMYLLWPKP